MKGENESDTELSDLSDSDSDSDTVLMELKGKRK